MPFRLASNIRVLRPDESCVVSTKGKVYFMTEGERFSERLKITLQGFIYADRGKEWWAIS